MTGQSLRRDVLSVGAANTISFSLQFMLPIVVARTLLPDDFAGYRMVWLVVATLMAFATLAIPGSLSYFLPRIKYSERASYIIGAVCLLIPLATISSILVNPWYPLLPIEWVEINGPDWFFSVFIFFWILSSIMDTLPVADGRAAWQAGVIVAFALIRVCSVSLVAWLVGTLESILYVLIIFTLLKMTIMGYYINKYHNKEKDGSLKMAMKKELIYSWSFGLGSGFFTMRSQAERWMVAALFNSREFASFSLGSVAAPLFGLIRRSVNNVVFPNLSSLEARNDKAGLAKLNRKATSTVSFVLIPMAMMLWIFADEVITIVYTETYSQAASVMRIYLFGVIPELLTSAVLLRVTGLGGVALKIDLMMLPLVITASYVGIQLMGLSGGALGSVVALYVGHYIAVTRGASKLGLSFIKLYDVKRLMLMFFIALLSGILGQYFVSLIGIETNILYVVVGGLFMMSSYLILTIIFRVIPEPILQVLNISQKFARG